MQGLTIDTLASKRIPAGSAIRSIPRLVADYASRAIGSSQDRPAVMANDPPAKAATPKAAAPGVTSSVPVEQDRTYSGSMAVQGDLTATSNQTGTWSGTLADTMYLTVDSSGTGTGFESFSGNITLTVTNPDGSQKSSTSLLSFVTPDFTLQRGTFSFSQSSGLDFSGLFLTLNLGGSFGKTQATFSSHLALPFTGSVNGVLVNGSISGAASITDPTPLLISGGTSEQTAYVGGKVTPFRGLLITDLNATTVTATVTLSNPANGTLSNLASGTYNRAKGVYTITGGASAVSLILAGLTFDPTGQLNVVQSLSTGFTLSVTDGKGASLSNGTTSVVATNPLSMVGLVANLSTAASKAIAPFRDITIGDRVRGEIDIVKVTLSNPHNGTLTNLSTGYYNRKTGVYVIEANAAAVTTALRGLKFDPTTPSGSAAKTGITISVRNAAGAYVNDDGITITANSPAPATTVGTCMWSFSQWGAGVIAIAPTPATTLGTGVTLFSQYVAAGLHGIADHLVGSPTVHDLPVSSHFELVGGHR